MCRIIILKANVLLNDDVSLNSFESFCQVKLTKFDDQRNVVTASKDGLISRLVEIKTIRRTHLPQKCKTVSPEGDSAMHQCGTEFEGHR